MYITSQTESQRHCFFCLDLTVSETNVPYISHYNIVKATIRDFTRAKINLYPPTPPVIPTESSSSLYSPKSFLASHPHHG